MSKSDFMSYKQFRTWCNHRAADGCWGITTVIVCVGVMTEMQKTPFWKRKK
jgi:hypothetical protein